MQLSGNQAIAQFWNLCQHCLFPFVEQELGTLSEKMRLLASAFTLLKLDGVSAARGGGRGRPPCDRVVLLRAFLAKSALNLPTTRDLLDRLQADLQLRRLCGWEGALAIPSESVFSRAFAEFAASGIFQQIQQKLVAQLYEGRMVGHVLRDSTAIQAREKPARKTKQAKPKRKRGRPRKGEPPAPKSRLERQPHMPLSEMLEELPKACDRGVKIGSNGLKQRWIGYKFHWDVSDSEIPLSCVLTSASTHDSQVAIPLATMTAKRVTAFYELMDAGYHSPHIQSYCEAMGHVALIPDVARQNKPAVPMEPARRERYKLRSAIERLNSRLKDEFGGRHVRVRGHQKVLAHLMLGVLMLAVDQVLRLAVT